MTQINWTPQRLDPDEAIPQTDATLGDFWSWAFSDILSNITRAAFAEFMVGSVLGCLDSIPRLNWDMVDLCYRNRLVEVKSSAYVQSWPQKKKSDVVFDIEAKKGWNYHTNTEYETKVRCADCYVFCLFTFYGINDKSNATQHITDADSWRFCVIPTITLNRVFGSQKKVRLGRLKSEGFTWVPYGELRAAVDAALG